MARTIEQEGCAVLLEGRACEREDLCRDIVKELGKREQEWVVASVTFATS